MLFLCFTMLLSLLTAVLDIIYYTILHFSCFSFCFFSYNYLFSYRFPLLHFQYQNFLCLYKCPFLSWKYQPNFFEHIKHHFLKICTRKPQQLNLLWFCCYPLHIPWFSRNYCSVSLDTWLHFEGYYILYVKNCSDNLRPRIVSFHRRLVCLCQADEDTSNF